MDFGGSHNHTGMDIHKGHKHLLIHELSDIHIDRITEHLAVQTPGMAGYP